MANVNSECIYSVIQYNLDPNLAGFRSTSSGNSGVASGKVSFSSAGGFGLKNDRRLRRLHVNVI